MHVKCSNLETSGEPISCIHGRRIQRRKMTNRKGQAGGVTVDPSQQSLQFPAKVLDCGLFLGLSARAMRRNDKGSGVAYSRVTCNRSTRDRQDLVLALRIFGPPTFANDSERATTEYYFQETTRKSGLYTQLTCPSSIDFRAAIHPVCPQMIQIIQLGGSQRRPPSSELEAKSSLGLSAIFRPYVRPCPVTWIERVSLLFPNI